MVSRKPLKVRQVAQMLGLSEYRVRLMTKAGELPTMNALGPRVVNLYDRGTVEAWRAANTNGAKLPRRDGIILPAHGDHVVRGNPGTLTEEEIGPKPGRLPFNFSERLDRLAEQVTEIRRDVEALLAAFK